MKTALSGIPDDEKKAMSKKALADLKVYDDAYVQMESHHIPGKKTKLEFHLVDDMVIWGCQVSERGIQKSKLHM